MLLITLIRIFFNFLEVLLLLANLINIIDFRNYCAILLSLNIINFNNVNRLLLNKSNNKIDEVSFFLAKTLLTINKILTLLRVSFIIISRLENELVFLTRFALIFTFFSCFALFVFCCVLEYILFKLLFRELLWFVKLLKKIKKKKKKKEEKFVD